MARPHQPLVGAIPHETEPRSLSSASYQACLQTYQRLLFYIHSVDLFAHRRVTQYLGATGQAQADALSIVGQALAIIMIFLPLASLQGQSAPLYQPCRNPIWRSSDLIIQSQQYHLRQTTLRLGYPARDIAYILF